MNTRRILFLLPLLVAGCAGTEAMHQAVKSDENPPQAYNPLPPTLTPAQEAERTEARRAYLACLTSAARYADKNGQAIDIAAALIAPMCYPQFSRFEAASTVGMESRAKRTFDHDGDKRQVELAAEAIRQERGVAVSAARQ